MRPALLLLVGMLLVACTSVAAVAPSSPFSVREPVADAQMLASETVALAVRKDDGSVRAYCSGVWLSPTIIVTADHCTQELDIGKSLDYVVRDDVFAGGEVQERKAITMRGAMLVARDLEHDLALLYAPAAPEHGIAVTSSQAVRPGMPVQTMGHPLGMWWSYSSGDVAGVRELDSEIDTKTLFVQATAPISPGSSGGGLFDEMGRLVGICHGSFTRGQSVNVWVHYQYVSALLASPH